MSESVKHHLRLLALVRWQVLRNGLRFQRNRYELAAQVALSIFGGFIALVLGASLGVAAYMALRLNKTANFALLLWIVFLAWQLFPVLVEMSSRALNFREIARYPVSFRLYYLLNTAYGLLDPSALMSLTWLAGIWAGTSLARPDWAARAALLFLAFAVLNLFFSRVLFGFVERVMSTRRGREGLLVLGLTLFVVGQGIASVVVPRLDKSKLRGYARALAPVHSYSPPGLILGGLTGGWGATDASLLGMGGYTAAAAFLLRRQLWRNYRGEVFSETVPTGPHAVQVRPGWKLPLADEATSAVLEKELRYALRDPRTLLSFSVGPLMAVIGAWSGPLLQKAFAGMLQGDLSALYPVAVGYSLLTLGPQAYNFLCHDSRGFQRWLMAPLDFGRVLLAKNVVLGLLLAANFVAVTLLMAAGLPLRLERVAMVAAGYLYASLAIIGAGNLLSVRYPVPIEYGTMSAKKVSSVAILLGIGIQLVVMLSLWLVFHLAGRWNLDRLPLVAFFVLIAAAAKFYQFSLRSASEYTGHHAEEISAALA